MRRFAGIFSIVVGFAVIVLWTMLLLSHQVPELATEPYSILFHISTELIMAALLIISGVSLLLGKKWSIKLFSISSGLLIYSVLNSSGYYVQNRSYAMVVVFGVILLVTVLILAKLHAKQLA